MACGSSLSLVTWLNCPRHPQRGLGTSCCPSRYRPPRPWGQSQQSPRPHAGHWRPCPLWAQPKQVPPAEVIRASGTMVLDTRVGCFSCQDSHTRRCHLLTCGSYREAIVRRGHRAKGQGRVSPVLPGGTRRGQLLSKEHAGVRAPHDSSRVGPASLDTGRGRPSPREVTARALSKRPTAQTPHCSVGSTSRDDSRGATCRSAPGTPPFTRIRGRKLTVRKTGCTVAAAVRSHHAHSRQGQPHRAHARGLGGPYTRPRLKPARSSGKAFSLLFLIKMIFCNHESSYLIEKAFLPHIA